MDLIWEMKRKRMLSYLKGPFIAFLIIFISLFTSWALHVFYSLYTDTQAHMSISEWVGHLYAMLL